MKLSDIAAQVNDIELYECCEAFDKLPPEDRLSMSHIDLAEYSEINDLEAWKRFLAHPLVRDFLDEEIKIFTMAQQRKLITTATDNDRSVGAAQMINALGKTVEEQGGAKSGEIFIYSYVPLDSRQEKAPNVRKEGNDIFGTA